MSVWQSNLSIVLVSRAKCYEQLSSKEIYSKISSGDCCYFFNLFPFSSSFDFLKSILKGKSNFKNHLNNSDGEVSWLLYVCPKLAEYVAIVRVRLSFFRCFVNAVCV